LSSLKLNWLMLFSDHKNFIFLDIKTKRITDPFLLFVNCYYTKNGHLGIL